MFRLEKARNALRPRPGLTCTYDEGMYDAAQSTSSATISIRDLTTSPFPFGPYALYIALILSKFSSVAMFCFFVLLALLSKSAEPVEVIYSNLDVL